MKIGIGSEAMAANRVKGARCALCWNTESARLGRQHNDANCWTIDLLGTPASCRPVPW